MSILYSLRGLFAFALIVLNTLVFFVPVLLLGLIKLACPMKAVITAANKCLDAMATSWIEVNNLNQNWLGRVELEVQGDMPVAPKEWYMLIANHQSWVDILILQRLFNRRIPFIKFFLKQALIWVPFIGLAWWALDFPFMRRYSAGYLKKYPQQKGKDIEITRKACEKYRYLPVTIMNFLEGTRFTTEKYQQQQSPYRHLLSPKAGGLAFALSSMNGQLHQLVDVTIVYPDGCPSMLQYLAGRVKKVQVHVRTLLISDTLLGDYQQDRVFREQFQAWVNQLWQEKDQRIEQILHPSANVG